MSFPNFTDLAATTIEKRSKKIANNVLGHNAVLAKLNESGRVKTFSGGTKIIEELSFAENGNAGWYSGYETLPTAPADVISAAEYDIKQAACPVVVSGLELLQNAGSEKMIDLLESRLEVAEDTMKNLVTSAIYSDGTGSGGKEITGLNAAVPITTNTGTYGGINRANWAFWQSVTQTGVTASTDIVLKMNALFAQLVRGSDKPDLIVFDPVYWGLYTAALQNIQRVTDPKKAGMGFPTLDYMGVDVVLDNVTSVPASTGFFLNTKYLKFRPHKDRNFTSLAPNKRYAINQDAEVQILAFAGNLTCSGSKFQGRLKA